MKTLIEKIRNKPYHKKTQIIWVCSAIAVALLLVVWAIFGIPSKNKAEEDIFQTFNQDFQDSKDAIPNPFPE